MSALLSLAEYEEIISQLSLPTKAFINGEFVDAKEGNTYVSINPANGKSLAQIAACKKEDVDNAVSSAKAAFEAGVWSSLTPTERKEILLKFADLIEENATELAVMEALESGKPIRECVLTDLPETLACTRWHAEAADKLYDQLAPNQHGATGMIVREPCGVVAAILPWNFPLMMLGWKLAPALASGNSVVVKPSEETSMTTLRLAQLAKEAGIPDGVFNVVTGYGADVGKPLGLHPDVQVISFTGSTATGRKLLEYASRSNLKRIILECGGKSPSVVLEDAENLDDVAEHIVYAALWNMGQNCTANSRVIVHQSVKVELTRKILTALSGWITGDPMNPSNQLGAIINRRQFDKILGYIENAKSQGATLLTGGKALSMKEGLFIEPTLFDKVTPDMNIAQEEIFGPVFCLIEAESDEQAIEIANNSCYGLQASLYTSHGKKAQRYAKQLQAGTVSVNTYAEGDITTPFGGYKLSGFGGRDNSLQAHDQYTETKTIWFDLSD